MSEKQSQLAAKHGTPKQFELAVWSAWAQLEITTDDANAAIQKYRSEWDQAERESK